MAEDIALCMTCGMLRPENGWCPGGMFKPRFEGLNMAGANAFWRLAMFKAQSSLEHATLAGSSP
jgi:hypothetical protein